MEVFQGSSPFASLLAFCKFSLIDLFVGFSSAHLFGCGSVGFGYIYPLQTAVLE